MQESKSTRDLARQLSAKLILHTTSVHNVELIAKALEAAKDEGRREALEEAADKIEEYYDNNIIAQSVRALAEKKG